MTCVSCSDLSTTNCMCHIDDTLLIVRLLISWSLISVYWTMVFKNRLTKYTLWWLSTSYSILFLFTASLTVPSFFLYYNLVSVSICIICCGATTTSVVVFSKSLLRLIWIKLRISHTIISIIINSDYIKLSFNIIIVLIILSILLSIICSELVFILHERIVVVSGMS